jgi:anthranilate phosphoribosyltransferase
MNRDEAHSLMGKLLSESTPLDFIAATLKDLARSFPAPEEMLGFLEGLLDAAVPLKSFHALDLCGTGGDGKNTFNISTAAAFVLSAMDVPVAKHGNSASSSKCGSSDVLKALGVSLPATAEEVEKQFELANLVFLHAPFFHPALKRLAPLRKELGIKTIFNLLGPLANPVKPSYQLIGVANEELVESYAAVLTELKRDFVVVHTIGGYDEITLTNQAILRTGVFRTALTYKSFGLESPILPEDLHGGDTAEINAIIIREILEGRGTTAQTQVVAANAATAAKIYYQDDSYSTLFERAIKVIDQKLALEKLELVCQPF